MKKEKSFKYVSTLGNNTYFKNGFEHLFFDKKASLLQWQT